VTDVSWSRVGGDVCIRVPGVAAGSDVRVRPHLSEVPHGVPAMAGTVVRDGDDCCFVPRFPFVDGMTYAVAVDGGDAALLERPHPDRPATTEVLNVYPTAAVVPRNLLRLYVRFSARMSEGYAASHVGLVDDGGEVLVGALLPTEHELWDAARFRLTVLLDPARIKRGLVGHREIGYPLRSGSPFRVRVAEGFRDATGSPLRASTERRYEVGADERGRVKPAEWALATPPSGTVEPLEVAFGRPLDHGLLARCLSVVGPGGRPVDGRAEVGPGERSWRLTPTTAWASGPHRLVVDPVLEDLAGNSVSRVFDRDLSRPQDDPDEAATTAVAFRPW
jgi:hypothetical protein